MSVEAKVSERYAGGAKEVEARLCCPVDYDAELLKILPQEIIDKYQEYFENSGTA